MIRRIASGLWFLIVGRRYEVAASENVPRDGAYRVLVTNIVDPDRRDFEIQRGRAVGHSDSQLNSELILHTRDGQHLGTIRLGS